MENLIKALANSVPMACALLLSWAAVAEEHAGRCSTANAAGRWAYTVSGQNTSGGPDAIFGSGTVDATGKVTLTLTEVTNGIVFKGTLETLANLKVNPDCTGTLQLKVFEAPPPETPKLVATATWEIVYVDNQREIFGILTNLVPAGGGSLPPNLPVQTLNAKRQFPGRSAPF